MCVKCVYMWQSVKTESVAMATQDNSGIDYFSSVPEGIKKSKSM